MNPAFGPSTSRAEELSVGRPSACAIKPRSAPALGAEAGADVSGRRGLWGFSKARYQGRAKNLAQGILPQGVKQGSESSAPIFAPLIMYALHTNFFALGLTKMRAAPAGSNPTLPMIDRQAGAQPPASA